MKIGSHDTMSYAKPESWWMRPFHFMCKCQSLNIYDQYKEGVRLFDMRVKWDKKQHCWKFAHGLAMFKTEPVEEIFSWLNQQDGHVLIRLVLEYNKPIKNMSEIEQKFKESCQEWVNKFSNISWFEFVRKYDWKKLFTHENEPRVDIYQATSSTTCLFSTKWSWLDDWFPWLYAKLQNHDNIVQGTHHEYMLLDFIEIR